MAARILIVEDNVANMKLMSYLLKAFGHEVLTALDGTEVLEIAQRERPDLIICDVQLPRVDGYEVARRLKNHPALKAIPLVAVTALAMVGDRDRVLAAGFDGYLPKPIVPQTFVKQVEGFLPAELSKPVPAAAPPGSSVPALTGKGQTVLAVDNSPVNLELVRKILEPFGYVVRVAASMKEGLESARQVRPNLILSDLHMPVKSGFDFINEVKADPELRSVPFVFLSLTVWHDRDKDHGLALGADRFIIRPIARIMHRFLTKEPPSVNKVQL